MKGGEGHVAGLRGPITGAVGSPDGPPLPTGGRNRRQVRPLIAVTLIVGTVAALALASRTRESSTSCSADALQQRALSGQSQFTHWLARTHSQGYIGEVGWPSGPDAARWNALADRWYSAADRAQLWVTAWAAGEWWPSDYRLAAYRLTPKRVEGGTAGTQAQVIERHLASGSILRGVDVSGGSFGVSSGGDAGYSNDNPGTFGHDYYYEQLSDYRFLAGRGIGLVRVPILWERVQPRLGAPLKPVEVKRIRASLIAAQEAGLRVILDLHNYGSYRKSTPAGGVRDLLLGSEALPDGAFADVWRRLAQTFGGLPAVVGFGLMNEPHGLTSSDDRSGAIVWEEASQEAVNAIRATGDQHTFLVSGYNFAAPGRWDRTHPQAWIQDPIGLVRYEAHQYFDRDGSGHYLESYDAENAQAKSDGFEGSCHAS